MLKEAIRLKSEILRGGITIAAVFGLLMVQEGAGIQIRNDPGAGAQDNFEGLISDKKDAGYVLGPGDVLEIWALGIDEVNGMSFRIDAKGYIDVPMIGRLRAGGSSVEVLERRVIERLTVEVLEPEVAITVKEFRSHPVSLMGAVKSPGVYRLKGEQRLVELLSMAGGLLPESGRRIKITRKIEFGRIPLATAFEDSTGGFSLAEVNIDLVIELRKPAENIVIKPHDVIAVPRAGLVYVIGAVNKPGGFVLRESETMSVLQSLSMAEGFGEFPNAQKAKILRRSEETEVREEIAIDLKEIMKGKAPDVALYPEDILLVPTNTGKKIAVRIIETAVPIISGLAIYRR